MSNKEEYEATDRSAEERFGEQKGGYGCFTAVVAAMFAWVALCAWLA